MRITSQWCYEGGIHARFRPPNIFPLEFSLFILHYLDSWITCFEFLDVDDWLTRVYYHC